MLPSSWSGRIPQTIRKIQKHPSHPSGLEVITSGERKWELRLQDIAGARQTIDLEYYLLADDASGRMIRDALEEKVREGVRVRLLIENVTNFSMRKAYYRQMEASGIEVRILLPRKTGSPPKPSNPVDWTRAGRFIYHVLLAATPTAQQKRYFLMLDRSNIKPEFPAVTICGNSPFHFSIQSSWMIIGLREAAIVRL